MQSKILALASQDLSQADNKILVVTLQMFSPQKVQGIPVSQKVRCNMHINIMGSASNPCKFSVQVSMQILLWKNMYILHVISLKFTGYPCKFCMDITKKQIITWFPYIYCGESPQYPCKIKFPANITMEIRVWRFQNYRDCGYTCNPHKFEIPALRFPCGVPPIPC